MESVSFKLPPEMVARLEDLARGDDVSVGVDQRLLAPLRARVSDDFVAARDWSDLRDRLMAKGYTLRESGGGLALHEAITGRFLCRTSEIGFGYPALLKRFSKAFPGHSHAWLLDRIREVPVYVKT